MLELQNRRTGHRVRENLMVEYYGDDFEVVQARTIDLSAGGARLISSGVPNGNHFHVSIFIQGHRLTALADKAWQASPNSNGSAVVGFQFSQMNRRDRRLLHDYCGRQAQKQNEKKLPRSIKLPETPDRPRSTPAAVHRGDPRLKPIKLTRLEFIDS